MENLQFSLEDKIIDLEWCSKHGHTPPKNRKYRIIVDREKYVVHSECLTGKEILSLAGKLPVEKFQLRQKLKGGVVKTIAYEQVVCFTEPGIEKFKTLPLDQTEGEVPKRDFPLLEEDAEYLDSLNLVWETINYQGGQWVLIIDYPLPIGYNVEIATLAIRIAPGYPISQLDMIYFYPAISRTDGQPIGALTPLEIDGRLFQQWSRHRTGENPWRPGIDNLSTHVPLADVWLKQEFIKRPSHALSA